MSIAASKLAGLALAGLLVSMVVGCHSIITSSSGTAGSSGTADSGGSDGGTTGSGASAGDGGSDGGTAGSGASGGNGGSGGGGAAGPVTCNPGDSPVELADVPYASFIKVDADFVYVAGQGGLKRIPKGGGPGETLIVPPSAFCGPMLDGPTFYSVQYEQVAGVGESWVFHSQLTSGGPSKSFPPIKTNKFSDMYPLGCALNATHVFFAEAAPLTIWSAHKVGAEPVQMFKAQDTVSYFDFAGDDSHLYAVSSDSVLAVPALAPAEAKVIFTVDEPYGLLGPVVPDGDRLFLAGSSVDGALHVVIQSAPKDGQGLSAVLATEDMMAPWMVLTVRALATDADHVYWGQSYQTEGFDPVYDGRVIRVGKDGSDKTVVATGLQPAGIAVDDTCLYWTDIVGGKVWRAPK